MTARSGTPAKVFAVRADPYIAIQDWAIDDRTTLSFARLTLEQAVTFRDQLDDAISVYQELVPEDPA